METIYRLFVHRRPGFDGAEKSLLSEANGLLKLSLADLKEFARYDVSGLSKPDFEAAARTVFSEPQSDGVYYETLPDLRGYRVFATEYLPGQYDQRADSCEQCIRLLTREGRPAVRCARVFAVKGADGNALAKLKKYLINPVEAREAALEKPATLFPDLPPAEPTPRVEGFRGFSERELKDYYGSMNFAMSFADLKFVQDYFTSERRDPTLTEMKVLDTYWSDHCRHTTFLTELAEIEDGSGNPHIAEALQTYKDLRAELYQNRADKYPCLMDVATIAMKKLKKDGKLPALDESEEINACSVKVKADVRRFGEPAPKPEEWLVMFKNETHNHPTEIEPFGGAATCLGGAIRDPLSGRSYVYQAMRVTGAADPTVPLDRTLTGKLPQRVLTRTAAAGFSSYGNQIGLCTGMVREYYHPGYAAKRLETGFVIGAAPASHVIRNAPVPGDVVILLGGDTGRDGCGGATGSSKAHDVRSVELSGAEVQKGNPLTERKIQRLFADGAATRMIKRCNDFGAGGVCVAIGELADGLDVDLNAVPKKYEGLSATELAISESQERMAVVVAPEDAERFIKMSAAENLSAAVVARVTDKNRMRLLYNGEAVADLRREMLNSAGVRQRAAARITGGRTDYLSKPDPETAAFLDAGDINGAFLRELSRLNVCGQKGLIERFDSSVTGGSVAVPLGGKTASTPAEVMAALLPVHDGETDTCTVCAHALNPDLMSASPFLGAVYSVVVSVIRLVVSGVPLDTVYLTLQEYFPRLKNDPERWGKPLAALLGAMAAQLKLGVAAIGGKDSMSGTFEDLDVPPTLISFAVGAAKAGKLINNVFKAGAEIYRLSLERDVYGMPDFGHLKGLLAKVSEGIEAGVITAAAVVDEGGAAATVVKSCFGDGVGFDFQCAEAGFCFGDIVVSVSDKQKFNLMFADFSESRDYVGRAIPEPYIASGSVKIPLEGLKRAYDGTLGSVFPITAAKNDGAAEYFSYSGKGNQTTKPAFVLPQTLRFPPAPAKPRVLIPAFPGTNGEYDMAKSFARAGAEPKIVVIRNRSQADIEGSVAEIVNAVGNSQIIAFPGGFSAGDEPDGCGKFIAAFFRESRIRAAVEEFRARRRLILGICNGFQALVKLGLLPSGQIGAAAEGGATLTFNTIGRHVATVVKIRVSSANSPWLSACAVGEEYLVPISHGEGRFCAGGEVLGALIKNGQIATQYCGFNPNGSAHAIEGIISADGLIYGKMGHAERVGPGLFTNVPGNYDMKLFEAGVRYFR
ncbi:MAG: phosphoribosylformylglycinamidine synthase [Clostridiales bacterium]|jgi:phosphoribosylformylglycinamidine synthase|nr:phosphoribosylformylglycinamidine synthase [Clostridiales bacterium]